MDYNDPNFLLADVGKEEKLKRQKKHLFDAVITVILLGIGWACVLLGLVSSLTG